MDMYEWLPTECAPKKYPMQILKGDLFFENGGSIYIPDGKMIHNGWGNQGSTHLVGDILKPIPNHIVITWFSFTEDKFYSGSFDLPKEKMAQLFKEGFISPLTHERVTYDNILIGMAPEGGIGVWLMGEQVTKEICFLQANEVEINWTTFVNNLDFPRSKYVTAKLQQVLTPEDLSILKKERIAADLWKTKYRTQYSWEPLFISSGTLIGISADYYNGEREFLDYTLTKKNKIQSRAVPKSLLLNWMDALQNEYSIEIVFGEQEIFMAFSELSNGNQHEELNLQIEVSDIDRSSKIFIKNKKYITELKQSKVKVYKN